MLFDMNFNLNGSLKCNQFEFRLLQPKAQCREAPLYIVWHRNKQIKVSQCSPLEVPSSSSCSICGMCSIFHNIFDRCDLCNRLWLSTFPFVRCFCSCVRKTYRIVAIVSGFEDSGFRFWFWVWVCVSGVSGFKLSPGDHEANELTNLSENVRNAFTHEDDLPAVGYAIYYLTACR